MRPAATTPWHCLSQLAGEAFANSRLTPLRAAWPPQGDWRGISRQFVLSRTPTQVASHAQKYFIRQNNLNKRKRRSSLFDIVAAPVRPPPAARASCRAAARSGRPGDPLPPRNGSPGTDNACSLARGSQRLTRRASRAARQVMPLPLSRDGKGLGGVGGAPWASPALAAQLAAQLAAAQACGLRPDGAAPPPGAGAPSSLFGGLPSGMHAGALLASLGVAGGAGPGGPAAPSPLATSPGGTDALLPLLYRQWLAGGAPGAPGAAPPTPPFPLTGAAFHRLALVPTSTLFRPVPRRATTATWGMVKSASMPELRELRMDDSADDASPLAMPRQRPANGAHSNGTAHEDSNGVGEGGGRGRDGAMSPIEEGPSDSVGGATPSSVDPVSAS